MRTAHQQESCSRSILALVAVLALISGCVGGQMVTPKTPRQTVSYAESFAAVVIERAAAVKPMLKPDEVAFLDSLFTEAGGYLEEAHRLVALQPEDSAGWQAAVQMSYQVLFQVEQFLKEKEAKR